MQHKIDSIDNITACVQIPDVSVHETESRPTLGRNPLTNLIQVMLIAGFKIINANYNLA
ncbi:hypothetical protein PATSB16_32160 [Pandoraea thiooxydans]|nr:hypothetical protein PATSB16_32160 [Pandoraea thiooxydans]